MEFAKWHDATDTMDFWHFCPRQLLRTCYGFATGKFRGNWCNGFWS